MGTDRGTLPFSVIDEGLSKRTKQFIGRGMSREQASKVAMQELLDKLKILDLVDNSPADSVFIEET